MREAGRNGDGTVTATIPSGEALQPDSVTAWRWMGSGAPPTAVLRSRCHPSGPQRRWADPRARRSLDHRAPLAASGALVAGVAALALLSAGVVVADVATDEAGSSTPNGLPEDELYIAGSPALLQAAEDPAQARLADIPLMGCEAVAVTASTESAWV